MQPSRTARRGPGPRTGLAALAALLVVVTAVLAFVAVRGIVQRLGQQAGGQMVDRSGPVLLQSMRDLARYEAAAGTFQVIVDLRQEAAFLPPEIVGQRTLFVAVGEVDAYVDFSRLADDAVTVSQDRHSASVRLPHAGLEKPALDHDRSHVFAEERGIVNRVQTLFDQSPDDQAQLYQVAERKIGDAAAQSGLTARAEANTRTMLESLLRGVGYQQVTITFA